MTCLQRLGQRGDIGMRKVATGQRGARGPGGLGRREEREQLVQRAFRQTAIGCDLAAKDIQQWRACLIQ